MNEADTRAELIDPQLLAAGWKTDSSTSVRVRREYPITAGEIKPSGFRGEVTKADYVLEYKNTKLAVIEAKRDEEDVSEGVAQSIRDAQKLRLKISFAANGKEIYEINHESGERGLIDNFPSPDELWNRIYTSQSDWFDRLNNIPFEDNNGTKPIRYYQELAVNNVTKAIAEDQKRILLTLATGTGKTFIAFQIAWKLFKSKWTINKNLKRHPRILFITDRNFLADQAFLDFSSFQEDALIRVNPKDIEKDKGVPMNGNIFFTIFQTFLSGPDKQPYFGQYEKDFFDLIIIDECHRGGAKAESEWRSILNYFSESVHLGLTATPNSNANSNTYKYFGKPVFIYSLKEGIQDGFLTPFKVKRIQSTIDDYQYDPNDEILEGEIDEDRVYEEGDFNRIIVNKDRERKRVQEFLKYIDPQEKTLVFCASQPHAAMVRDLICEESKNKSVDYCVRVTSKDGKIGENYLKIFKDNEKIIPTILTTSRKLSTGLDAKNLRNIVLMRPVNNIIEFKQIVGRGTRVFEGKYFFTIIDFVNAYYLFNDPEWDGEPVDPEDPIPRPPLPPRPPRPPRPSQIKVRLSDNRIREIQTTISTYFFVSGKTLGVEEFLNYLFDEVKLPKIFKSESELRKIWSNPITRRDLLEKIEKEGCDIDDLRKLQEIINAKNSDLFDVLEYIAYAKKPLPRELRVEKNRDNILNLLNKNQREFVDYVLRNYINEGIDELDISNLSTVLMAKYGSINAAQEKLGNVEDIKNTFVDFQKYLYQEIAA